MTTSSWNRGTKLLLVGWPAARRALDTIFFVDGVLEYVVTGRRMPSSWIWRRLKRTDTDETGGPRAPDATPAGRA